MHVKFIPVYLLSKFKSFLKIHQSVQFFYFCLQVHIKYNNMNCQHFSIFGKVEQNDSDLKVKNKIIMSKQIKYKNQIEIQQAQDQNEKTIMKPSINLKQRIAFDEQQTSKVLWKKGKTLLAQKQLKQQKLVQTPKQKASFEPSYNKQVQQILSKQPLRQRFANILPLELQYPIAYNHQQLIKRMQLIDKTMQFLVNQRSQRILFFETIKKSIFDTSSVIVQLKMIQQVLFLDKTLYQLQWAMNTKINRYDIKVKMSGQKNFEVRKANIRKKIVQFLLQQQQQFIVKNKLQKSSQNKWNQEFDYKSIQIPQLPLPLNQTKQALTTAQAAEKQKITYNPTLHMFFSKNKQGKMKGQQNRSIGSASVADMIFSKVAASQISSKILQAVKQKQRVYNQQKQKQYKEQKQPQLEKQTKLIILDQIYKIYVDKKVSNMFKVTLTEMIQQRLSMRDEVIAQYLQGLLNMKELKMFKTVQSSRKVKVIQIDKQKYRQARASLSSSI